LRPHWDLSESPNRPPQQVGGIRDGIISRCASGRSLVGVARGVLSARLRADDGRNGGRQDRERTRPLSACLERSMAGREPFTASLFASEDPLCLSPEDDLRPPTRERTFSRRLSETRALASLPSVGENKRGLPTPGFGDAPVG